MNAIFIVSSLVLSQNVFGIVASYNTISTFYQISNASFINGTNHKVVGGYQSALTCAIHCTLDISCNIFGFLEKSNISCLVITTNTYDEAVIGTHDGYKYYIQKDLPQSCSEVPSQKSGYYMLQLRNRSPVTALCEMEEDGGGWTVFQKRSDGSENFERNWDDYKLGFGNPRREYWLGNDNLKELTMTENCTLRIELVDKNGTVAVGKYSTFFVGDEASKYRLTFGEFDGSNPPGDSLKNRHYHMPFTTYDADNDNRTDENCAVKYRGAWWHEACHDTNLNGLYGTDAYGKGITWRTWKGLRYSLSATKMMVRCP